MKCKFCGTILSPNQNRCPGCGRAAAVAHGDHTFRFGPRDIRRNHVISAFSYLSFLVLIPILFARRSHFARFHANQGLVLLIFHIAYTLITRIFVRLLDMLFGGVYAVIPTTLSTIFNIGSIVFLIFMVLGMVHAAHGRAKELPIIGRIRFLL